MRLQAWWIGFDKARLLFVALVVTVGTGFAKAAVHLSETHIENRELKCLARNIYHEARGEPLAGQYAVAEVTLNRVRADRFPDSVCGVVYQFGWDWIRKRYVAAFSWTEMDKLPADSDEKAWHQALEVARAAYSGNFEPKMDGALFYHAKRIEPSWARHKKQVASIGRHVFYR